MKTLRIITLWLLFPMSITAMILVWWLYYIQGLTDGEALVDCFKKNYLGIDEIED